MPIPSKSFKELRRIADRDLDIRAAIEAIKDRFQVETSGSLDSTLLALMLLEDLLVCGAGYLNEDGVLDASIVVRLLDSRGQVPKPPDPAYQQLLNSLPIAQFTTCELKVLEVPRAEGNKSVYPTSPVEDGSILNPSYDPQPVFALVKQALNL